MKKWVYHKSLQLAFMLFAIFSDIFITKAITQINQPDKTQDVAQSGSQSTATPGENPKTKNDFNLIDIPLTHVSISKDSPNPIIVGIGKDGAVKYNGTTWENLGKNDLQKIEISGDGTIFGIDASKQVWRKDLQGWVIIPKLQLDSLKVGNKFEVWGINKKQAIRLIDPTGNSISIKAFLQGILDVGVGGDGDTWIINEKDSQLYRFKRSVEKWETIIKPGNAALGVPQQIVVADRFNVAFADFDGKIWKLIPGKNGTQGTDWKAISEQKVKSFSLGYDGTIIAITQDGKVAKYTPSTEEKIELENARGNKVQANDIISIISEWDGRQIWTRGSSIYDQKGTNPPPGNYLELLVGPSNDNNQFIGSFFMVQLPKEKDLKKDEENKQVVINFGDTVEIYSIYAAPGIKNKSGLLNKEWKWWVNTPHAQLGKDWCDIVVSLISHAGASDGRQLFKIISPYGQTGPVRENDIIQLVSQQQNRSIFVRKKSLYQGNFYDLVVPVSGTIVSQTGSLGSDEQNGSQYFSFRRIIEERVQKVALQTYQEVMGKFGDPTGKQAGLEKKDLKPKMGDGIGLLSKLVNLTSGPLVTSKGEIAAGGEQVFGSEGLKGFIDKQVAKIANPKELGLSLDTVFKISGVSQEIISESFESGSAIQVQRLFSKGIAWINESLETAGSALVIFFAKAGDDGNIQVCFGNKISHEFSFRVVIGGWNNSKTAFVVGDSIIAETKADVNPLAKVPPGQVIPYWISMHNNFVMAGIGAPGDNIILASSLPYKEQPTRIGFSSHQEPVSYTEVMITNPIILRQTGQIYKQTPETISVEKEQGKIFQTQTPFRVSNTGSLLFEAIAPHTVTLALSNSKKESYRIELGANGNKTAHIVRNGETINSVNLDSYQFAKLDKDRPTQFWMSIDGGKIIVGQGNIGTNAFMFFDDPDPLKDILQVGFVGTTFKQEIKNITQGPPIILEQPKKDFNYKRDTRAIRKFNGQVILVQPFSYQIAQDGPRVLLKNMDDDSSSSIAIFGTPMQNGRYPFMMTIMKNGKPEVKGMGPIDAPEKFMLEMAAQALSLAGDKTFQTATQVGRASTKLGIFAVFGVLASAGIAAAGIGIKAGSAKAAAKAKYGFRSHDSYVRTEEVINNDASMQGAPKEAVRNERVVNQLLVDLQGLKLNVKQDYEVFIGQFQEILRRINHPYVIQKLSTRTYISEGLKNLIDGAKAYSNVFTQQLISTLILAVTNPYLKIMTDSAFWSRSMSEIIKQYLFRYPNEALELPPLKGNYIWLPREFIIPDQGGISFEVKASNDLFVCFAQEQFTAQGSYNPLYEILLGGWENSRHEIHVQNLGRAAIALNKKENLSAMLSSQDFEKYFIAIVNGRILIYKNSIQEKPLIDWKDPFPWNDIKAIGFSSWDTPISIKSIKILIPEKSSAKYSEILKDDYKKSTYFKEGETYEESIRSWQQDMQYREDKDFIYRPPKGNVPQPQPSSN